MANDTTILVQFGRDIIDDGGIPVFTHLSAELDRREDGLNGGSTSFEPGDTAYFLIYKSPNVTLEAPVASAGTAGYDGTTSVQQTQDVVFANSNEANLSIPVDSVVSQEWLGTDLGVASISGTTVTVPTAGVGVLRITYMGTATIGFIQSPSSINGSTDFSVVVLIVGNVTA